MSQKYERCPTCKQKFACNYGMEIAIAVLLSLCLGFVIGKVRSGPKVTWTDVEVLKQSPNQDTFYKVLDADGEKFYFTVEQVNMAKERANSGRIAVS